MSGDSNITGNRPFFDDEQKKLWIRRGLIFGVPAVGLLILFLVVWHLFYVYVPPGKMLVRIAKTGDPLPAGQTVAEEGQKGVQRKVLGEGWHFVMPILYTTELHDNVVVPPGKIGVVTALGGKPLPPGRILTDKDEEQGIRRQVLPPGSYRLNPYELKVEIADATRIDPGYVGVLRRLLGKDNTERFATNSTQKGILPEVLQPGLYYINPKEYEVIHAEVGVYQTSFHYNPDPAKSTAIEFQTRKSYKIQMDCTIEWEILPRDTPMLAAELGTRREGNRTVVVMKAIERNVIDQHVEKISRDRGLNYSAQELLEGKNREKFQEDFTNELERACREKNVLVRSAFIREILIPEKFLKQKREKQLAAETEKTNLAWEKTAESKADLKEAEKEIEVAVAGVHAETAKMVAGIQRDMENVKIRTEAKIEEKTQTYAAQIAVLDAQRTLVLGQANAEAKKMKDTATNSIYKLKMEVFDNDTNAYLRYQMAEKLNEKMVLRLFQSGEGTLWTNMGQKNLNLMLPVRDHKKVTKTDGTSSRPPAERK